LFATGEALAQSSAIESCCITREVYSIEMDFARLALVSRQGVNVMAKRFAGGGGRPGAKPTFNWKERRALGLEEVGKKRTKSPVRGDFADLEALVDKESFINILEQPDGFTVGGNIPNDKKLINPAGLFGSGKPRGAIQKKRNYGNSRFSHTRIFGKPARREES
jgi:hypothetical protein